jgi:hypothetical protein
MNSSTRQPSTCQDAVVRFGWLTDPGSSSSRLWGVSLLLQVLCVFGFGIDGFYHSWSFIVAAIWLIAAAVTTKRWRNAILRKRT